jgi:hypothetical protein
MICSLCGEARATKRIIVTNSKDVAINRANVCGPCTKIIMHSAERNGLRVTIIYLKGGK